MTTKTRLALIPVLAATLALTACSAPTVEAPKKPKTETVEEKEAPAEEPGEGTRANPAPIGSTVTDGDWAVTIDSVNLNANDIAAANEFNDPPADGNVYILVTATITYKGEEDAGEHAYAFIDYVTADGKTISEGFVDMSSSGQEDFTIMDPIYPGGTHTGVTTFEVPAATAGDGVLAITPTMGGDRKFVAVK